jgi:hypothetical protein
LKKEVEEFVNSLLKKRRKKNGKKLRPDWAGALRKDRDLKTRTKVEISEAEHARILGVLNGVTALSVQTGPPVSNRDHDGYLYGGQ